MMRKLKERYGREDRLTISDHKRQKPYEESFFWKADTNARPPFDRILRLFL